ncbi:hypothetical protein B0J12DRAFT_695231 [Macrophomina phaseolina]|uniref:Chitin-binding type-1 domain-containing protein n=1 Tax=Macrophomina phaseolina TaxID=35725 RepID=A0ABQ8GR83_9PEZI|nr:hypothetical protein B0J12DRAFT_695231 [Macrophomina phaseolina]
MASLSFRVIFLVLPVLAQNSTMGTNSTTSPSSNGTSYPLTTDGQCGANAGTACLTTGVQPCCSMSGWCGDGDKYCSNSTCAVGYGSCTPRDPSLGPPDCGWSLTSGDESSPRCDGRCGSAFGNARCNQTADANALAAFGYFDYGPCCSTGGYCGGSEDHCSIPKGCQSGCDESTSTSASSSAAPAATSQSAGSGGLASGSATSSVFAIGISALGAVLWV